MPVPAKKSGPEPAPRFPLGQIVATANALTALVVAKVSPWALLSRHRRGDWGDLDEQDQQENERALIMGNRLLSAYALPDATRLWIITEADRSATTLLLPDDY